MKYLLNSSEMKACDTATIEYYGVPSAVLMERAALSVVEEVLHHYPDAKSFLSVCGSGNNGGDGLVIARLLFLKGFDVQIVFVGKREKATTETARQLAIAEKYEIPIVYDLSEIAKQRFDVIFDSIFGIGLSREITGNYFSMIEQMNAMEGTKVAVDIASGVSADTGKVLGIAFRAELTVTFGFAKIGQILYPGAAWTGRLAVKDIGIDAYGFRGKLPECRCLTNEDLTLLPKRKSYSNKGTYGKVLVIAGTVNMAGAACFSASAAYRTGAGLVRVFTPEENRIIVQSALPEAVLTTYQRDALDEKQLLDVIDWASVIVVGPGLGTDETAGKIVSIVLKHANVPCVVDADALNLIAKDQIPVHSDTTARILTPHLGEMARLCGRKISEIQDDLIGSASEYAQKQNVILTLKDARTVTAFPDGQIYLNCSGTNGMATGGSGDVLTGIIAGLLAQGVAPEVAASLGVYLHGLAGEKAAEQNGAYSMTARNLLDGIKEVLYEYGKDAIQ